jgi:hypothetical protein
LVTMPGAMMRSARSRHDFEISLNSCRKDSFGGSQGKSKVN